MTEGPFGFPIPEEFVQMARQAHDQHVMLAENRRNMIDRLWENLSDEDLATLRGIFSDMSDDQTGRLSAYYEGIVASILTYKRNKCSACGGEKHDGPESLLQSEPPSEEEALRSPHSDGTPSIVAAVDEMSSSPVYVDMSKELIGQTGMIPESVLKKMIEYNVDDLREEGTNRILGFICLNCRVTYPSLEDRMLKAPDDCSGCHQMAKWG